MSNVFLHPAWVDQVPWLRLPTITVPMPDDPDTGFEARVSGSSLVRLYLGQRKTPIWQAWAHLVGDVPPIPNASLIRSQVPHGGFGSLMRSSACFQGLNRPHCSEHDGDSVLAYVMNPSHTLRWHSSLVCTAAVSRVPSGTVLVVYVRKADALQLGENELGGTIIGWEFIPADPEVPTMPDGFKERYARELWRR